MFERHWLIRVRSGGRTAEISRLNFMAQVSRSTTSDRDSLILTLINANPEFRRWINQRGAVVEVYAGYLGSVGLLFSGDIDLATNVRNGPDWNTMIKASSASEAFRTTVATIEIQAGSPVINALSEASRYVAASCSFGLFTDHIYQASARKWTMQAPVEEVIQELCTAYNLTATIQDGVMWYLNKDTPAKTNAIKLVAARTQNMLGPAVKTDQGVYVSVMLDAAIRPGDFFAVAGDDEADGTYLCTDMAVTADSEGQRWMVEIEGRQSA